MKTPVFILTFLFISFQNKAQQLFFIAIDADQQQPFAVLMAKKAYSSDSQGHLLLPGLKDSIYELTISFPRNSYPDHTFSVPLNRKDRGFQLKKIKDNSWGLYDWQTLDLLKPITVSASISNSSGEIRKDAFAVMMAGIVNDTAVLVRTINKTVVKGNTEKKTPASDTLLTKTVPVVTTDEITAPKTKAENPPPVTQPVQAVEIKKEEIPKEAASIINSTDSLRNAGKLGMDSSNSVKESADSNKTSGEKQKDSLVISNLPVKIESPVLDTVDKVNWLPLTIIRKVFDNTGKESRAIIFRDSSGAGIDTITIKIDLEILSKEPTGISPSIQKTEPAVAASNEKSAEVIIKIEEQPREGKKTADTILRNVISSTPLKDTLKMKQEVIKADSMVATKKLAMVNSDCVNKATDADLDKLRVKMLAATSVDDRIVIARKLFKTKCFYTRQVKALTELFYSDESRYRFFDAAYPFIVDTDEFKALVQLLTDDYFIGRFKAMVRY